jgi:cytochrome c6
MSESRVGWLAHVFVVVCAVFLPPASASAQDAASVYKSKCATCHGADGSGNTAVGKSMHLRDLGSADVQKQSDADLTSMIANGKGAMPAFKDKLSAEQIKQLVGFIRQLAKRP